MTPDYDSVELSLPGQELVLPYNKATKGIKLGDGIFYWGPRI